MALITGDELDNKLSGADSTDTITGLGGSDTIGGGFNHDVIDGGAGNDSVSGGGGDDRLIGGSGDDVLYGFDRRDKDESSGIIDAKLCASGLDRPVFATSAPGDPGRLFVVEQHEARIQILDPTTGLLSPFLDLPNEEISTGGEQGLLGLAFDPNYETTGKFFVFLSNPEGNIEVRSYTRSSENPAVADPSTGNVILTIEKSDTVHYGGWMAFGPDGFLYISVGDGNSGGDPANNAQNLDSLQGKILRIDVNGDEFPDDDSRDYSIPDDNPFAGATSGADEIWAYGLRNPWRNSFDRLNGNLYIADVGESLREELNFQAASSDGGDNYGWKVKEGTGVFDDTTPGNPSSEDPLLVDPVFEYLHGSAPSGGFSVTGGYVYRGQSPGMQGLYFFADFITDQLWTFQIVNGHAVDVANRTSQLVIDGGTVDSIVSFGEDGHGNLYVIGLDGEIHRLDPHATAGDGTDRINGGSGNDRIFGGAGSDFLFGGDGADRLSGGLGNDKLDGGADGDSVSGGSGSDTVFASAGEDTVNGGSGIDVLDFANITAGRVIVNLLAGAGTQPGGDTLSVAQIEQLLGTDFNDRFTGDGSANLLSGRAGNDAIKGGQGGDTIDGGTGRDTLTGGNGADRLLYDGIADSAAGNADFVVGFNAGTGATSIDILDLSLVDGDAVTDGAQTFNFIGTSGFTSGVVGELRVSHVGSNTLVSGDTNGDTVADFQITLKGLLNLTNFAAGDFNL